VGDRLDTDIEGARAARMPGLLVLTGVTGVTELLEAPPQRRPDYVGRDLWSLRSAHPQARVAEVPQPGGAVRATCGEAAVSVIPDGGRTAVRVQVGDGDALDLVRAAAVATWAARDANPHLRPDAGPVINAVRSVDPVATWAR
jgi:hypothetical protein